jgi:hypothetical protein
MIENMPAPRIAARPVAIASNKVSCGLRVTSCDLSKEFRPINIYSHKKLTVWLRRQLAATATASYHAYQVP